MRKFIDIISEASMPFGRLGNMAGFTFGFEAEMLGHCKAFADSDIDIRDIPEEDLMQEFDVDEDRFAENFAEWQEDHPDGDYYDWIEDVGLEEWMVENRASPMEYAVDESGDLVRYVNWSAAVDIFAEDIREEFGIDIITAYTADAKIENKDYQDWHLEGDGSVHGNDENDHPFEVISPVFHDYDEFARMLKAWLDWQASRTGLYTNRTTGLHINIGAEHAGQIDPLKLLLFSGEKWMTKHWRGKGNGFTDELLPQLTKEGLPASVEGAREIASKFIKGLNEKSFAINMLTLIERGYVEFRPIGNQDYEHRVDEVFQHISRFVQLIQIAADPNMYRREYAKKLGQLLVGERKQEPVMDYEQKMVKKWLDTMNLYAGQRQQIQTDVGEIVAEPKMVFQMVASLEDTKPIPTPVLKILARRSGLAAHYQELRAGFEQDPWPMRQADFEKAAQRLDPLFP